MEGYYGRQVEINEREYIDDSLESLPTGEIGYLLKLSSTTDIAYVEMPNGQIRQYNFRLLRFVYPGVE